MLKRDWAGRGHVVIMPTVVALLMAAVTAVYATDSPFGVSAAVSNIALRAGSQLVVSLTVPVGHHAYADRWSVSAAGAVLTPLSIPTPDMKVDAFTGEEVRVYAHDTIFTYGIPTGSVISTVTVELQGCNASLCFLPERRQIVLEGVAPEAAGSGAPEPTPAPETAADTVTGAANVDGFELIGRDAGFLSVDELVAFLDRTDAGKGIAENPLKRIIARHGILLALLVILLGGAALNLTPCVLPMIPVNLAIIGAGAQAGSRLRGFLLGSCYGAGIALAYGGLGLVVVLTGGQFGQLNASPWFNLAMAAIFAALALSMFGVFNLDFSRFQGGTGGAAARRGSVLTAFVFGALAALLAGACVAPVLIWVLLLATEVYQRGNVAGLALPFVLGLGMALPWPFAGAGMSFLPRPGKWMERVKIGFGIVIAAAALYYGAQGVRLLRGQTGGPAPGTAVEESIPWVHELDRGLALARGTGRPVFVDLWASWCKTCKKMSRTTFQSPVVRDRLVGYVPVKLQAEDPGSPALAPLMQFWEIKGLPSYVVLMPSAKPSTGALPPAKE